GDYEPGGGRQIAGQEDEILTGGEQTLYQVGRNRNEDEDAVGERIEEGTGGALRFFVAREPAVDEVGESGDGDQRNSIPRIRDEHEREREHDTRQRNRIGNGEQ